jgi:hypothetical protein
MAQRSNVFLRGGQLILEARDEGAPLPNGSQVSSGKITSTPDFT